MIIRDNHRFCQAVIYPDICVPIIIIGSFDVIFSTKICFGFLRDNVYDY